MALEPQRRPSLPGASIMPVQPDVDELSVEWLDEAELQEQADRLDRLAADNEMVQSLAFAGFEGRDYDYFATELAKYGLAVMSGWMRRGLIWARCRERRVKGIPAPLDRPFDIDEIEELANEAVALALLHFRDDVLMKKVWDYRKRATLRTFFIGQCLMRFGGVYRSWYEKERAFADLPTDDDTFLANSGLQHNSTASRAVDAVTAQAAWSTIKDDRVRFAMRRTADGWKQSAIAEQLGVTERTVERMLANERKRLEQRRLA
jgi:hypothetical protein